MVEKISRRQWSSTVVMHNPRPDLAAEASISAGAAGIGVTKASILNAQKLIRKAHARIYVESKIRPNPPRDVRFAAFHDAGWATRPGGSSQGGYFVTACHSDLLEGKSAMIYVLVWKSWKLNEFADRACPQNVRQ